MATENDLAQAPRNSRVGEADPKSEFSSNPLDVLLNDPSTPKEVRQVMGAFMRMGPVPPPHLSKITPEHITQFIESTERDSQREHEREKWAYWFSGFCMAFVGILFLIVMWYLVPTSPEMFQTVLGFLAGLGCGFGIGKSQSKRKG